MWPQTVTSEGNRLHEIHVPLKHSVHTFRKLQEQHSCLESCSNRATSQAQTGGPMIRLVRHTFTPKQHMFRAEVSEKVTKINRVQAADTKNCSGLQKSRFILRALPVFDGMAPARRARRR